MLNSAATNFKDQCVLYTKWGSFDGGGGKDFIAHTQGCI